MRVKDSLSRRIAMHFRISCPRSCRTNCLKKLPFSNIEGVTHPVVHGSEHIHCCLGSYNYVCLSEGRHPTIILRLDIWNGIIGEAFLGKMNRSTSCKYLLRSKFYNLLLDSSWLYLFTGPTFHVPHTKKICLKLNEPFNLCRCVTLFLFF